MGVKIISGVGGISGGTADETTLKKIAELEELVKKQNTLLTNQAIAINKDRELLTQVDTDLNGLVGDVSE